MARTNFKELLEAGVHFGHLKSKWNPAMAPFIFDEKKGIHIIDLNKTVAQIEESANVLKQLASSGKKILFVATKKQAKEIVAKKVKNINMPFVTERWPGGMLTNFATIRKAIRKMAAIDKMATDGTFDNISKRERLQIMRQRDKLERNLGSIADLNRLPAAIFVVDVKKEHIAISEAKKLNIPTFAIVDTNSDPSLVSYPIAANDDASKSIEKILDVLVGAIQEGLGDRKQEREKIALEKQKEAEAKEAAEKLAAENTEVEEGAEKVEEKAENKKESPKKVAAKKSTPKKSTKKAAAKKSANKEAAEA